MIQSKDQKKKEWKRVKKVYGTYGGFPGGTIGKEPPTNAGDKRDVGLIPGLERSPGVGNGNPLQEGDMIQLKTITSNTWLW